LGRQALPVLLGLPVPQGQQARRVLREPLARPGQQVSVLPGRLVLRARLARRGHKAFLVLTVLTVKRAQLGQ
jgi:hypothetical protein